MNWKILLIAFFSLFTLGFVDNARGPLYPLILGNLQISFTKGSLFFSIASCTGLLTNLFSKYWLPKLGAYRALQLFTLFQFFGTLGIGLLPNSFNLILLLSAIYGISLGGTGIAINILVARSSTIDNRRKTFSGLHSMYAIASILSPLIVAFLISKHIYWAKIFLYFSILPFLFFLLTFLPKDSKQKLSTPKTKHTNFSLSTKLITGGIIAPYVAAEIIISSRLPLYLTEMKGFDSAKSSIYLVYFFIFLLTGRLIFAVKHFNISSKSLMKISLIFSTLFFILGLTYSPIFLSLCALPMSFYFPCSLDYFTQKFPKAIEEITSWVMICIGSFLILVHSLFGIISQNFGIHYAFSFGIILLFLSFISLNMKLSDDY